MTNLVRVDLPAPSFHVSSRYYDLGVCLIPAIPQVIKTTGRGSDSLRVNSSSRRSIKAEDNLVLLAVEDIFTMLGERNGKSSKSITKKSEAVYRIESFKHELCGGVLNLLLDSSGPGWSDFLKGRAICQARVCVTELAYFYSSFAKHSYRAFQRREI